MDAWLLHTANCKCRLRIQPRSAKTIRGSGRWLMAASKSTVTLQRWPLSLFVLCLTSYFPCLSVQKSVMHIWNWFETHCAVCWCCMEKEVTKWSSPNNSKWWRAWRLAMKKIHYIHIYIYTVYNAVYINKEMWYMKILIIGGWFFTFSHVRVLWLQLILSWEDCARKSVESKSAMEIAKK